MEEKCKYCRKPIYKEGLCKMHWLKKVKGLIDG